MAVVVPLAVGLCATGTPLDLIPDGVSYLDAARNVLAGRGPIHTWAYWDPVYAEGRLPTASSLWPPGYPLAVAGLASLGPELAMAALLVNLLSSVACSLLLFILLRPMAPPAEAALGAVLSVTPFAIVRFVPQPMSEVAFLSGATLALAATGLALREATPGRRRALWLCAGVAAAGAAVLRYAGLATCASVAAAVLWRRRLGPAAGEEGEGRLLPGLAIVPPLATLILLAIRNLVVSGSVGQPLPGADTFWSSLAPGIRAAAAELLGPRELLGDGAWLLLRPLQAIILVGLGGMALRALGRGRRPDEESRGRWLALLLLFVVPYLAFQVVGCAVRGMILEERYLTSALPWILTALWGLAVHTGQEHPRALAWARVGGMAFCACQWAPVVRAADREIVGYVSAARGSPTLAWLRGHTVASELVLTTRGAEVAYWCPDRRVLRLPRRPHSGARALSWEQVDALADRFGARYLVHLGGVVQRARADGEAEAFLNRLTEASTLAERAHVRLLDGIVFLVGRQSAGTPPADRPPPDP